MRTPTNGLTTMATLLMTKKIVSFRIANFDRAMRERGLVTLQERAELIGCSRNQLWNIQRGRSLPGNDFIAGVLDAFPTLVFDYFFKLTPRPARKLGEPDDDGAAA